MSELDIQDAATQTRATKSGFKYWPAVLLTTIFLLFLGLAVYLGRPAETPVMQAAELLRSGKAAAAVPILEKLSRDHPDDGTVYPWLAEGYLSTERPAEGRTALDTALRLNLPAKILMPVVLKYANYYTAKGHFEEAEKLFQSATSVVTAKEAADSRARLYMSWAEDDLRKSNLQAAVNHLNIAMSVVDDVDEPMKSMVPHRLSECLRQLAAVAEVSEKNDRKAIELLEKALTVSDEPLTRMNLALIYARSGKNDLAIENYQRVSSADPNNLEARHHLIDLLCQKGDYKGAQLALVDLTERERSMENFQLLAGINLKLKNYAGAVRALEDACDIGPKPELLKQLESTLLEWAALLTKQNKPQEAASVKGHADRIAEQLALIAKTEDKTSKQLEDEDSLSQKPDDYFEKVPPIALSSSRIWLAKGSLTPEGEIRIKNISGRPVKDLTLAAVFYDNSTRRANGSVTLPVASPNSPPFETGGSRTLYFSCPNIVKTDHRLAVVIMWKGRFLKEFPVVKQL